MAIDTSIYGQIRPFRLRDPLETAGNALAVQNAQQANELNALKAQYAQDDRAAQLADEEVMRQYFAAGGGEQNLGTLNARPRARAAEEARLIKLAQDRAQTGSQNATARKNDLDAALKAAERRANLLRSATDQQSWTMLRDVIGREMGPDALSQVPNEFNERFRDAMISATVDEAKRLELQRQGDNDLIVRGPDGRPTVNEPLVGAKSRVAAAGVQQQPIQLVQTPQGYGAVPTRITPGATAVNLLPVNDPSQAPRPAGAPGAQPRAQPAATGKEDKRPEQSRRALDVIADAEKIIPVATGSLFGAGRDVVAGAFGGATEGAKAIAQLKALEANLMLSQPRMEGPQSNQDVLLYRQAAAQIGDPKVPRDIKMAALQSIKTIHERYATPAAQRPAAGGMPPADAIEAEIRRRAAARGG